MGGYIEMKWCVQQCSYKNHWNQGIIIYSQRVKQFQKGYTFLQMWTNDGWSKVNLQMLFIPLSLPILST